MRAAISPRAHLFVCANRREGTNPLGPGCSAHGDAVYDAMKRETARRGRVVDVWVTKTHCLGICPKQGATIARYPGFSEPILTEVEPSDVPTVFDSIDHRARVGEPTFEPPGKVGEPTLEPPGTKVGEPTFEAAGGKVWEGIEEELGAIEELQTKKVLDLARRLKPGLTLEDVQNPHDFPELDDSDWHYADGILTGVKSVSSALRAKRMRDQGESRESRESREPREPREPSED